MYACEEARRNFRPGILVGRGGNSFWRRLRKGVILFKRGGGEAAVCVVRCALEDGCIACLLCGCGSLVFGSLTVAFERPRVGAGSREKLSSSRVTTCACACAVRQVHLSTHDSINKNTAKASLQQMLSVVFTRMEAKDKELKEVCDVTAKQQLLILGYCTINIIMLYFTTLLVSCKMTNACRIGLCFTQPRLITFITQKSPVLYVLLQYICLDG